MNINFYAKNYIGFFVKIQPVTFFFKFYKIKITIKIVNATH